MYGNSFHFRPKKKVGQIYINIPGVGSMSVEEDPKHVGNLQPALEAAKKAFDDVYIRLNGLNVELTPVQSVKDKFYDVYRALRLEATREEFDKKWEQFDGDQEVKRLYEEEKRRASEE